MPVELVLLLDRIRYELLFVILPSFVFQSLSVLAVCYVQVCCYDPRHDGALFTSPPYAGVPTVSGATVSDYKIYEACCIDSNVYCNVFLQKRPIDHCDEYAGPAQGQYEQHHYSKLASN